MGVLDDVWIDEIPQPQKKYDKRPCEVNCDGCGRKFTGQAWMLKSRSNILCGNCFVPSGRKHDDEVNWDIK